MELIIMYSTTGEYYSQSKAITAVTEALRKGLLNRPEVCELCNKRPVKKRRAPIHAHHWNGYDHPTDIWWICASCNGYLASERFHIGKVSKDEARAYIESRTKKPISGKCRAIGSSGKQCGNRVTNRLYCHRHREKPTLKLSKLV